MGRMASVTGTARRPDHVYGPGDYGAIKNVESLQVTAYPTAPNWDPRFHVVAYGADAYVMAVAVADFALEADAIGYVDTDPDGLLT